MCPVFSVYWSKKYPAILSPKTFSSSDSTKHLRFLFLPHLTCSWCSLPAVNRFKLACEIEPSQCDCEARVFTYSRHEIRTSCCGHINHEDKMPEGCGLKYLCTVSQKRAQGSPSAAMQKVGCNDPPPPFACKVNVSGRFCCLSREGWGVEQRLHYDRHFLLRKAIHWKPQEAGVSETLSNGLTYKHLGTYNPWNIFTSLWKHYTVPYPFMKSWASNIIEWNTFSLEYTLLCF